jgi:hypothetical protein
MAKSSSFPTGKLFVARGEVEWTATYPTANLTLEARNRPLVLTMCLLANSGSHSMLAKSLIKLVEPGGIEPPTS